MRIRNKTLHAAYAVPVVVLLGASGASAQSVARANINASPEYPTKAVRILVPLAPGGGSDIVARIVGLALTDAWGQSVIVDNRPGAGTTAGTSIAAKSPADGYTLLVSSSSIAISPALYKNLDFDIKKDFAGVTLLASQPSILVVHSSVAASSVKDLVAYAKANPGKLTYGSAGVGSATHLGAELFKYSAGADLLHVPYKSAGLATTALIGGEVQVLLTNMASLLPHAKSGRIKMLGISSPKRSPLAPEVPTIAGAGVPRFEYTTWYGMLAPRATPQPVVAHLYKSVAKVLQAPQVKEKFSGQGLEVYASTPGEFEKYLAAEIEKWDKVVKAAGIKAE